MTTIFVPTVLAPPVVPVAPTEATPCGFTDAAAALAVLIRDGAWQRRRVLVCDQRLIRAASWKAAAIAAMPEPAHDVGGESPNELIRRFGFPTSLGPGNSCESIVYGSDNAETVLAWLRESEAHRKHIEGEGWYASGDCLGVGYTHLEASWYKHFWCVLIAKEE